MTTRRLHVWLGIPAALFLFLSAGTGVLLTFRSSLGDPEPTVPPALRGKPALSWPELVKRGEAEGGAAAAALWFSTAPDEPFCVELEDGAEVYLAPSGELVLVRRGRGLTGFLFDLHTGAIGGRAGEVAMAAVGSALLGILVTGYLIWPWRLRRAKARARVASGPAAG